MKAIFVALLPLLPAAAAHAAPQPSIHADRLVEFAWRTIDNPSSGSTASPELNTEPVAAQVCHALLPNSRLSAEQAGAAALGQSWVLGSDKTVRVGAHSEYCLDIDGAKTVVGTPLITYRCNNISINGVHNQQLGWGAGTF